MPDQFQLGQNYPNPFNPTTTIEFDLPHRSHLSLVVFNTLGQTVRTIIDGTLPAGNHVVVWDGRDNAGHAASSGVYLYRLTTDSCTAGHKMLLIK